MARFPTLHRQLVAAVLATAGLSACDCPPLETGEVTIALEKGAFAAEVDACLADDLACADLCYSALEAQGFNYTSEEYAFNRCLIAGDQDEPLLEIEYYTFEDCGGIGRRPAGLRQPRGRASALIGAHLAAVAHLEAASIVAFIQLARELRHHGAPDSLSARALDAADDERRHAEVTSALARRAGGRCEAPAVSLAAPRSLVEVAIDNAVEGCVRELHGAAVAFWQASHAADLEVRAAMRTIAAEEAAHAQLSVDIDSWIRTLLSDAELARLDAARARAVAELMNRPDRPTSAQRDELRRTLGLPDDDQSRRLALTLLT